MTDRVAISFLLRIGLAFTFAYAGIQGMREPTAWVGFLPLWLRNIAPADMLLAAFSIFELCLAVWLASGRLLFWASILAALTLAAITLFNLGILDITFRDIGLFFAAVALALTQRDDRAT